jgi:hypothetical protein
MPSMISAAWARSPSTIARDASFQGLLIGSASSTTAVKSLAGTSVAHGLHAETAPGPIATPNAPSNWRAQSHQPGRGASSGVDNRRLGSAREARLEGLAVHAAKRQLGFACDSEAMPMNWALRLKTQATSVKDGNGAHNPATISAPRAAISDANASASSRLPVPDATAARMQ